MLPDFKKQMKCLIFNLHIQHNPDKNFNDILHISRKQQY